MWWEGRETNSAKMFAKNLVFLRFLRIFRWETECFLSMFARHGNYLEFTLLSLMSFDPRFSFTSSNLHHALQSPTVFRKNLSDSQFAYLKTVS